MIKTAEDLVNAEAPDANEIEIMKRQLTDAMVKLVLSVDNEQLKSLMNDLSDLDQKDYTKDSWKQLQDVLKEAQDVVNNHDATKEEINDMYQRLLDAYDGLVTLNDKSGLTDLISKADQLQEKDYTKESWKQMVEELTKAKEVSAKEDATKEEINEAISNLEKAMNNLKKVDSSTKDDNTSKGDQVITSTDKNDKKPNQSSTAKTGDETNIVMFVLMAIMSWLGIKKVKKEEL
ncbi:MAG: FIVAR domain-containing protein [Coprobacillus sp.]|nr:FIVAR domain-containing protein [Coprobacillus sp.]